MSEKDKYTSGSGGGTGPYAGRFIHVTHVTHGNPPPDPRDKEIARLKDALVDIKKLTSWPANKTDHRLPVVAEAHRMAIKGLGGTTE